MRECVGPLTAVDIIPEQFVVHRNVGILDL
jgi:hypothetical protein